MVKLFSRQRIVSCFIIFLLLLNLGQRSLSQDSCDLRISLLTCSPGDELYSTFGHSALRVSDSVTGRDVVFNYGTFNFAEPGFYMKFVRGKLLYYLSTEDFMAFAEAYRLDNRSIIEQVLNLTCAEKEQLVDALLENLQPENRAYKYDFLFDNCTTRLRDLIEKMSHEKVSYPKIIEEGTRFRDLIHIYLNHSNQHWSKFGIDLLLGAKTDAVMTNREAMFLPDYLMKGLDSSRAGAESLVAGKSLLFKANDTSRAAGIFDYPLFWTSLLSLLIILLSFSNKPGVRLLISNFDSMYLFLVGVLGIIMCLMWFATDHVMCRNNYNVAWALPTHTVIAFLLNKRKSWVKKYLILTIAINLILLATWFILPQQLNTAIIPLILLIMFRSYVRITEIDITKKLVKQTPSDKR
jgi:hypothetical protein